MFLINTLLFLYIAIPFLAPVFMKIGWENAGRAIYTVYKPLCHQFAFRSWFLFGEQAVYPLELAHLHYPITYEDITNHVEVNPLEARNLVGDGNLGYKVALCERDIAIWGSLLITGARIFCHRQKAETNSDPFMVVSWRTSHSFRWGFTIL